MTVLDYIVCILAFILAQYLVGRDLYGKFGGRKDRKNGSKMS